ncbi:MAG: choline/ethanolamine kinase family protein [Steroidobacteraceae bacterium]
MRAVEVAAEVLSVPAAALSAERIKGGLTNESWYVHSASEAVVVRISTADEQALQLNRASEAIVLQVAQQADIGAEVLLCAPQRRLLVTRKLVAETLTLGALHQPVAMTALASLLRRLHALPVPDAVQRIDLTQVLQGYWHTLDARGPVIDVDARVQALHIAEESARVANLCLCHNDIHHLNLLSNGQRLWLLDWEYAGIGDPFFDLASVCCYHGYDVKLRSQLLSTYLEHGGPTDFSRLQRMCWLFDYIKNLWLTVRQLD